MTIGLTYAELKAFDPCQDSLVRVRKLLGGATAWGKRSITAAEAREAGATFNDIVWTASALARVNPDVERRLRLWMADCAARVLHIFEADHPGDMRPREAIIAARAFARGEMGAAARAAAWAAARAAAWDAEEAWQFDRLIERLSDPEPEDIALPDVQAKAEAA